MHDPKPVSPDMWDGAPAGRLRDLPESVREEFRKWLRGSAAPGLNGVEHHDQDGFYIHDYRMWQSKVKRPDWR